MIKIDYGPSSEKLILASSSLMMMTMKMMMVRKMTTTKMMKNWEFLVLMMVSGCAHSQTGKTRAAAQGKVMKIYSLLSNDWRRFFKGVKQHGGTHRQKENSSNNSIDQH